jgi:cyclic beta-1,2-glucan synthetase
MRPRNAAIVAQRADLPREDLRQLLFASHDAMIAALVLIPASALAIDIVQWLVAYLAPQRRLARLDLKGGVPEEGRTMVIIPTLLTSVARIPALMEHLDVQALGNIDPHIHFAIIGDFADAPAEVMPDDG